MQSCMLIECAYVNYWVVNNLSDHYVRDGVAVYGICCTSYGMSWEGFLSLGFVNVLILHILIAVAFPLD